MLDDSDWAVIVPKPSDLNRKVDSTIDKALDEDWSINLPSLGLLNSGNTGTELLPNSAKPAEAAVPAGRPT